MKRILSILFIVLLLMLVGCSNSSEITTQKTEEELKAEIRAEMEKEQSSSNTRSEDEHINKEDKENVPKDTETTYTDDEMITTYAYLNNDSIDVSSLRKIKINLLKEIDAIINADYKEYEKEMTWKIDFFGTVKNVVISQSAHYSTGAIKLKEYDVLTDTELSITAREMGDGYAVFCVRFEDEQGAINEFTSWMSGRDIKEVELHSGFTREEKTPTIYYDFDLSPYLGCIGMSQKEFLNSDIGQKSTKESLMGGDDYDYVVEIAKGIQLTYHPDKEEVAEYEYRVKENADIMSINIALERNDEGGNIDYNTIPKNERISMFGVDFSMTGVRAKKHFNNTLDDYEVSLLAYVSSEDNVFDGIWIAPKK